MRAHRELKSAAIGFAFAAVCALHPGLWRRLQESEGKKNDMPAGKRIARTVIAGVALGALAAYAERTGERLREENPELFD